MIKDPKWKYRATDTKIIRVVKWDEEEREVEAIDLAMGMPFVIDVPENIVIEDLRINKIYRATIKVYTAKITPEIEKIYSQLSKESDTTQEIIYFLKRSGAYQTLYKFELILLEPL